MRYGLIVFLQGQDYDDFEKALYPEREGVSLGMPDCDSGLDYLARWDYGEAPTDVQTEYPWVVKDLHWSYERRGYVMSWSPTYGLAGLWVKMGEGD